MSGGRENSRFESLAVSSHLSPLAFGAKNSSAAGVPKVCRDKDSGTGLSDYRFDSASTADLYLGIGKITYAASKLAFAFSGSFIIKRISPFR